MFYYRQKPIKSVGFVGLGKSNLGVLQYLLRHAPDTEFTLRTEFPDPYGEGIFKRRYYGEGELSDITEDLVFLSPSVRWDKEELARASDRGTYLSSDADFFLSNTEKDVYAITGSDGKSTTSYLVSKLLEAKLGTRRPIGNFGFPMTPELDSDKERANVVELSSFQLMNIKPRSARALITNITENHLNWHTSFEEYIGAKRNLFENSKERVLNYDSEICRGLMADFDTFAVFSATKSERELRAAVRAEIYVTVRDGMITVSGEPMLPVCDIRAVGKHNTVNFLSAAAMAYGYYEKETLCSLAESFSGLAHRCELVCEAGGVKYYDSSIDSSPKRCAATLEAFSSPVTVILGGRSKGLDFSELVPTLLEKAKKIIITGECREEIENALRSSRDLSASGIEALSFESFYTAVEYAAKTAVAGESVVLSPAATSYDEFKNFEERGDAFRKIIKEITKRKGY